MTFLRSQKRILRLGATNWSEWREVYEGSTSGQMSQVLDHCGPLKPNLDSSLTRIIREDIASAQSLVRSGL
jgi:hypothetical protein